MDGSGIDAHSTYTKTSRRVRALGLTLGALAVLGCSGEFEEPTSGSEDRVETVTDSSATRAPDLHGLSEEEATAELRDLNVDVMVRTVSVDNPDDVGTVQSQSIGPGEEIGPGAIIIMVGQQPTLRVEAYLDTHPHVSSSHLLGACRSEHFRTSDRMLRRDTRINIEDQDGSVIATTTEYASHIIERVYPIDSPDSFQCRYSFSFEELPFALLYRIVIDDREQVVLDIEQLQESDWRIEFSIS